ncbi:MAG: hypothetical protein WCS74_04990 [Dehalococcoidales bacterium]|jgi:hypothetical protein|nr:hypothetical protein [Dehalococcoidales bacterium]
MDIKDERIAEAVRQTLIIRPPRQLLDTFGVTNIGYYMVTSPTYAEIDKKNNETVIRKGRVIANRPRVVTPYYLSRLEGFSSDARQYFDSLIHQHGANTPGIYYTYRNEPGELNIVSDNMQTVVERLNAEIERNRDPLMAIIKGKDDMWDVSLLKFIHQITSHSMKGNISQMQSRGLLNIDPLGVPMEARLGIEEMFSKVTSGELEPKELKDELDRWGLFEEYQDRFFGLFNRTGIR